MISISDPRHFFYESLREALLRLHLKVEDWTEFYLVELCVRQIFNPVSVDPLVFQMIEATECSVDDAFSLWRDMGDSALVQAGFYDSNLSQRGIARSYVVQMGGHAYSLASVRARDGRGDVYATLAREFAAFARALNEVHEQTHLRTPQDIVKLYESWSRTKSSSSMERLHALGINPGWEDNSGGES